MQELAVAQNCGQGRAKVVGNVGDQLHLEPFAGNRRADGFLLPEAYRKQLGFGLRKCAVIFYCDGQALEEVVQLLPQVIQVFAVQAQAHKTKDGCGKETKAELIVP